VGQKTEKEPPVPGPDDPNHAYNELIAKTWADEDFKARLLADPADTLRAEGWTIPDGTTVEVVQAGTSPDRLTLMLPEKPDELSDEQLDSVAGGMCAPPSVVGTCTTCYKMPFT
jgi:hypothetical protein